MHITPIMSLHYLVKHKCPKINNIYRRAENLIVEAELDNTVGAPAVCVTSSRSKQLRE